MDWKVEYRPEAKKDLKKLDPNDRKMVVKAIRKVSNNPLPPPNGLGKPLGNHESSKLSGYMKIKLKKLGYRVVYKLVEKDGIMSIIVISIRDDDEVYKEAERRINKTDLI